MYSSDDEEEESQNKKLNDNNNKHKNDTNGRNIYFFLRHELKSLWYFAVNHKKILRPLTIRSFNLLYE